MQGIDQLIELVRDGLVFAYLRRDIGDGQGEIAHAVAIAPGAGDVVIELVLEVSDLRGLRGDLRCLRISALESGEPKEGLVASKGMWVEKAVF